MNILKNALLVLFALLAVGGLFFAHVAETTPSWHDPIDQGLLVVAFLTRWISVAVLGTVLAVWCFNGLRRRAADSEQTKASKMDIAGKFDY